MMMMMILLIIQQLRLDKSANPQTHNNHLYSLVYMVGVKNNNTSAYQTSLQSGVFSPSFSFLSVFPSRPPLISFCPLLFAAKRHPSNPATDLQVSSCSGCGTERENAFWCIWSQNEASDGCKCGSISTDQNLKLESNVCSHLNST